MIMQRVSSSLRRQDWMAIAIELAIVILGVFIGVEVANWNQARVERQDTLRLLDELRPELQFQLAEHEKLDVYYATTGAYAKVALAGWKGDRAVSDRQFVIAAYEASQIAGFTYNAANWGNIFGNNQIQNIKSPDLRVRLIRMLTINDSLTDWRDLRTDYRQDVRHLIPSNVQEAIRAECGDTGRGAGDVVPTLPQRCDVPLPEAEVKQVAALLHSEPKLAGELAWHRAEVATFLANNREFEITMRALADAIDARGRA